MLIQCVHHTHMYCLCVCAATVLSSAVVNKESTVRAQKDPDHQNLFSVSHNSGLTSKLVVSQ